MKYLLFIFLFFFSYILLAKGSQENHKSKFTDVNSELNAYWDRYELFKKSDQDSSIYYLQLMIKVAGSANKPDWVAAAYNALGDVYYRQGYLGESVYNYLIAAKKFEELRALSDLANIYNSIGDVYVLAKDYDLAIAYFLQAKDIFHYERKSEDVAMVCRNLAICYTEQKKFSEASVALDAGKAAALAAKDYSMLSMIYNTLGVLNFQQNEFGVARDNYFRAIQYADSLSDGFRLKAAASNNVGEAYLYEENYDEAESWLNDALELKRELGEPSFTQSTINLLGRLYIEKEQFERAIMVLESGLAKEFLFVDDELGKGLGLIVEALVKANAVGDASDRVYLNQKFAMYSQKLIAYNNQLASVREELETIGKQQVVRLAVEKHSMNAKLGAAEEKNEKFKYAIIIPAFLLICAVISVYLSLRRNARYKKLYAGIEEVLGSRALKKPDIK